MMLDLLMISTFVILACGMDYTSVVASKSDSLPPLYWNASNPLFSKSPPYIQYVHVDQLMDIICPLRNPYQTDGLFYFDLYQVTKENFDSCNATGARRLLNCDTPSKEKKYTFLFQTISPSPWGLVFLENKSYYFISTSDGTHAGLSNTVGGSCTDLNMKLIIAVNETGKRGEIPARGNPVRPDIRRPSTSTVKYINTRKQINDQKDDAWENPLIRENTNMGENKNAVNGNGLIIGVVLGACAVLFIVLLSFLGYKVYRRRRQVKKYQSPGLVAGRGPNPQAQVTLLPISHQTSHIHTHGSVTSNHHHHHLDMQDMRPPPYNESILDHAGSTMEV